MLKVLKFGKYINMIPEGSELLEVEYAYRIREGEKVNTVILTRLLGAARAK